jgi:hypothetical protein
VRQQVIVPVLVFDQAEDLFTIGRESLRRRQRTDRLLEELSQLVENHAPARVATLLETGEDKHDSFDFESAPVRIVLSIREEALAHILPLRGLFPSMGRSELRLLAFAPRAGPRGHRQAGRYKCAPRRRCGGCNRTFPVWRVRSGPARAALCT